MRLRRSVSASASCSRSARAAWLLAAALFLLLAPSAARSAEPRLRVGVVDTLQVLEKLQSWQTVQARLREQEARADKTAAGLKKDIERLQAELEYFKPDSVDYKNRSAEIAGRRQKLAAFVEQVGRKLADESKAAREAALAQILAAVRTYAIAHDLELVVDARAALYVADGLDISLEVAREINKRYKEEPDHKADPLPPKDK